MRSPGVDVIAGCELPDMNPGDWAQVLKERHMLLNKVIPLGPFLCSSD